MMNTPDLQLSEHFRLIEFVRSQTADRLDVDNTPPLWIIERLRFNAGQMEGVRFELGDNRIDISSGFRCLALNRAIGSKDHSAHVRGDAADFTCDEYGTPREICENLMASDTPFDQLIWEHTWVHIGWARAGETPRRQVLTLLRNKRYGNGIIDEEK